LGKDKGNYKSQMTCRQIDTSQSIPPAGIFAPNLENYIFSRFAAGIGVDMASMLSPMNIAGIAPAHLCGRMVTINLVNYLHRNAGDDAWRWMFGLGAIPSVVFFAGVFWLPESPRWLMLNGREEKCNEVLKKIGGEDFSRQTMADIKQSAHEKKGTNQLCLFIQQSIMEDRSLFWNCTRGISAALRNQCGF
jgi:MFS family permease